MPDWKSEIKAHIAGAKLRPEREAEIVEEFSQHAEQRYQELLGGGMSPEEATKTVLAELRDSKLQQELEQSEEAYSEPVSLGAEANENVLQSFWQDIRYATRSLRSSPGFALVAIVSLALGIGANTTIFQLLDAVRMRALPVQNPQELVNVKIQDRQWSQGSFNGPFANLTYPLWEQIRERREGFSGIFAWGQDRFNTTVGGEARYANALWLSGGGFEVLGVRPAAGRFYSAAEDKRGCASPPVVLSYPYWQREFGGDPGAIGKTLTLEGQRFEIVGITPASFYGLEVGQSFDVAVPLCAEPLIYAEYTRLDDRQSWWLSVMGRLKPGWTIEKVGAQMGAISRSIMDATISPKYDADAVKHYTEYRIGAESAANGVSRIRKTYESPLWLLLGVTGLVLLIACANLANLLLARASARQHEIAVRMALGADRGRLIRQLLTESLLMAVAGAVAGLMMARTTSGLLIRLISTENRPAFVNLPLDWKLFGFTAVLALLTCLHFGLAPAIRATRLAPNAALSGSGRGAVGIRDRHGLRRALVVSQVALSLVLLVAALLFVRSLSKLMNVEAGFEATGLLVTGVDFSHANVAQGQRVEFQRQMIERVRAIPGVESAALTNIAPMSGNMWAQLVAVNGVRAEKSSLLSRVTPGYFKTMQTQVLAGRDFDDHDLAQSSKVAVVTERFAERYLGGGNPVGKTFQLVGNVGENDPVYEIVGLVRDSKYAALREDTRPIAYFPVSQDPKPDPFTYVIVRSNMPMEQITAGLKQAMKETNPAISVEFHVLQTQIREGMLQERLMAMLSSLFGFLAVVLATVGLYGVISYMVVRRTNEIGIRAALGATKQNILSMILREAGVLLVFGIIIGAVLSLAAGRAATTLLFGLKPWDPLTMVLAVITLALVAIAASYLPARRAATLDPMVALRVE